MNITGTTDASLFRYQYLVDQYNVGFKINNRFSMEMPGFLREPQNELIWIADQKSGYACCMFVVWFYGLKPDGMLESISGK